MSDPGYYWRIWGRTIMRNRKVGKWKFYFHLDEYTPISDALNMLDRIGENGIEYVLMKQDEVPTEDAIIDPDMETA